MPNYGSMAAAAPPQEASDVQALSLTLAPLNQITNTEFITVFCNNDEHGSPSRLRLLGLLPSIKPRSMMPTLLFFAPLTISLSLPKPCALASEDTVDKESTPRNQRHVMVEKHFLYFLGYPIAQS